MKTGARFAVCINNTGYEASLITRKIYDVIPDEQAKPDDLIRVVDESGEDYLYPVRNAVRLKPAADIQNPINRVGEGDIPHNCAAPGSIEPD